MSHRMAARHWIVIVSLLLMSSSANAWGPLGHKAVALIASERLTPKVLQAVRDMLGGSVGLDRIAYCADGMLYVTGTYDCAGAFSLPADPLKTTQPWHYIDLPISVPHSAASIMNYCPGGKDCVMEQIRRQAVVLGDNKSSLQQKRIALMFLVHIVGDQHQPLHGADDDDVAGTKKPVVLHGVKRHLHSLWDNLMMVEDWEQQLTMDPVPLVRELRSEITQSGADVWTTGDFVVGATLESHEIAKNVIYPQYAKDRGQNLGDAYQKRMQPIAKRRLAMAGVRLATILEKALGR